MSLRLLLLFDEARKLKIFWNAFHWKLRLCKLILKDVQILETPLKEAQIVESAPSKEATKQKQNNQESSQVIKENFEFNLVVLFVTIIFFAFELKKRRTLRILTQASHLFTIHDGGCSPSLQVRKLQAGKL